MLADRLPSVGDQGPAQKDSFMLYSVKLNLNGIFSFLT